MRFLSLFSGIEACSVAWKPLGWECAGVAELDKFPSAVLAHHYPDVPNLGDVTKITDQSIAALGPIDLVVGGSPCQDLSVAGKRAGLAGVRSGLFFEQMRIFHAARLLCGARWLLWENVPGAFSSNGGGDFALVVGAMAGCELDVPADGWGSEGVAVGAHGLVEWAVLDAQWFGVAQRRRRVFALLDTGAWASRPPVLLEPESLRGDSAPRREAGEGTAPSIAGSLGSRGNKSHTELDGHGAYIPETVGALTDGAHNGGGSTDKTPTPAASSLLPEVAWCLQAKPGHLIPVIGGGFDVAHSLRADGFDASEDGTGRGTPLVLIGFAQNQRDEVRAVAGALTAEPGMKQQTYIAFTTEQTPKTSEGVALTLTKQSPTGGGQPQCVAFIAKDHGADASADVAPTLRGMGHAGSHANGGGQIAIAIQGAAGRENPASGPDGVGVRADDKAFTLEARSEVQAVAFHPTQEPINSVEVCHALNANANATAAVAFESRFARNGRGAPSDVVPPLKAQSGETGKGDAAPLALVGMMVRRLTPRECERLQGFPDDYTLVPYRNKPAADGPRYKALGNSMAVPVMRWIGQRVSDACTPR